MEKSTPHCKLPVVKAVIKAGKVRSTMSALSGGAALGFDFEGIVETVMSLTAKDFYKSMTTHADHKIWQDVYRPATKAGEVYLKLTVSMTCSSCLSRSYEHEMSNMCKSQPGA